MAQYEVRDIVSTFATYEDYLDSQVDSLDKAFVEDVEIRRSLIELGLRGSGETLKRAEFDARKQADRERNLHKELVSIALASAGADVGDKPLLSALAAREELVRSGKVSTILFLRTTNKSGQEVSGYLDFGHRLQTDAWEPIFRGSARIGAPLPRRTPPPPARRRRQQPRSAPRPPLNPRPPSLPTALQSRGPLTSPTSTGPRVRCASTRPPTFP
jgi:hypothetical protein